MWSHSVDGAIDYSLRSILDMPVTPSQQSHGLLRETNWTPQVFNIKAKYIRKRCNSDPTNKTNQSFLENSCSVVNPSNNCSHA